MPGSREYKIRSDFKTEPKDPFRVYFNQTALVRHDMRPGVSCLLTSQQDGRQFMAIAWYTEQKLNDTVVLVSRTFQEIHGLKLEDRVTVERHPDGENIPKADSIVIYEDPVPPLVAIIDMGDALRKSHMASIIAQWTAGSTTVSSGFTLEFKVGSLRRSFKVARAAPVFPYKALYRIEHSTRIDITSESEVLAIPARTELVINRGRIGGLALQIEKLQEYTDAYSNPVEVSDTLMRLRLEGGILLHGHHGTGKSLLLEAVAAAGWQRVFNIQEDDLSGNATGLNAAVDMALQLEPSLIVFDRLEDLIAGKRADVLLDAFTRTAGSRVLLLGAASSLRELPERYRRHELFKYQINIPVPDSKARAQILKVKGQFPENADPSILDGVAARTHGFNGSDLGVLISEAHIKAYKRIKQEQRSGVDSSNPKLTEKNGSSQITILDIQPEDWEHALKETRPSAMYDVILETPKTRWSDIGGYHDIKKQLRFTIGLQIRYPEGWASLNLEPTRGILLYGPPGCSKTMIAKAVATEMGLNFLAIKGAEVLDKYVGESERKIREIFDTARTASPSIIFFDEIDALGATRASSNSGVQGGLHILTTMLNEMDGIEARREVFVLAATNMPEVLDAALMRPGRLDCHILVDLPDGEARQEILQSKLRDSLYPVEPELIGWLTEATAGYSGAEVVHVVKEAVNFMYAQHEEVGAELVIGRRCFEHALDRVETRVTETEVEKLRSWGKRSVRI